MTDDNDENKPLSAVDAAERYVVASAVLAYGTTEADLLPRLFGLLDSDDFLGVNTRKYWAAIRDMLVDGTPIEPFTVGVRAGILSGVSLLEIVDWAREVPTVLAAPFYAKVVATAAAHRRIQLEASDAAFQAKAGETDPETLIAGIQRAMTDITARRKVGQIHGAGIPEALASIERRQNSGGVTGLPTGIAALDKITGGFQRGDLVILAARTGIGKTAMAGQIALHAALAGHPVLYASFEMNGEQLAQRWISHLGQVDHDKIRFAVGLNATDWVDIQRVEAKTEAIPLDVYDGDSKLPALEAAALRWRGRYPAPDPIGLLVVDYVQQVAAGANYSREQEVAAVSRACKAMARRLDVPVLALAQLNRKAEDENRDPRLSDLRESGSLEQDADVVLFLTRERRAKIGGAACNVEKNRSGRVGSIKLDWTGKYLQFAQAEHQQHAHDDEAA